MDRAWVKSYADGRVISCDGRLLQQVASDWLKWEARLAALDASLGAGERATVEDGAGSRCPHCSGRLASPQVAAGEAEAETLEASVPEAVVPEPEPEPSAAVEAPESVEAAAAVASAEVPTEAEVELAEDVEPAVGPPAAVEVVEPPAGDEVVGDPDAAWCAAFLGRGIKAIIPEVGGIDDVALLCRLSEAEGKGKGRAKVFTAIAKRVAELEGA